MILLKNVKEKKNTKLIGFPFDGAAREKEQSRRASRLVEGREKTEPQGFPFDGTAMEKEKQSRLASRLMGRRWKKNKAAGLPV